MVSRRKLWVAACIVLAVAGCDWWLRITEVSGTVRIGGRPVRGVQVVFEPLAANRPRALATTGAEGGFRLTRLGPGNKAGAAAGRYRVKVVANEEQADAPKIPAAYGSASTLELEVVPGKPNVFDIDIPAK